MPRRGRRTIAGLAARSLLGTAVRVVAEAVVPAWMTWEGMVSTRQEGAAGRVETKNRSVRTADSSPQGLSLVVLQETGLKFKACLNIEKSPKHEP